METHIPHAPGTHGLEETPIGEYVDFQEQRDRLVALPYNELVQLTATHEYAHVIIAERKELGRMKGVDLIKIAQDTTDIRHTHAERVLQARRLRERGDKDVYSDIGYTK